MNVERLKLLADTVRKDYHEFDDIKIGFNMGTVFSRVDNVKLVCHTRAHERYKAKGIEGLTHCGCLIGFTLLLFRQKKRLVVFHDEDYNDTNREIDAAALLDLNLRQAGELFYGTTSGAVSGEDARRVIESFLVTGDVNWAILEL